MCFGGRNFHTTVNPWATNVSSLAKVQRTGPSRTDCTDVLATWWRSFNWTGCGLPASVPCLWYQSLLFNKQVSSNPYYSVLVNCSARPTALPLCYLVLFFTDNFVTINTNPTNRPLPRCHHFRRICPRVSVNLSFWVTVIGRPARYSVIASQSVDVASECGEPSSDKNAPSAGNYSIDHAKYVRVHIFQSSIH